MKKILTLILIGIAFNGFSQDSEIKSLIYSVAQDCVPENYKYFNLIDSSFILYLEKSSFDRFDEIKFSNKNNDFKLGEFVKNNKKSKQFLWEPFSIPKAIINDYKHIPKFESSTRTNILVSKRIKKSTFDSLVQNRNYNEIVVKVGKNWSSKRKKRKIDKAWKKFENSVRLENKNYYRFSTPAFSNNKEMAIIHIATSRGGDYYVYRKIENKWTRVYTFGSYVY